MNKNKYKKGKVIILIIASIIAIIYCNSDNCYANGGLGEVRNKIEIEMLGYLLERQARVSYEDILSGNGLLKVYEFLKTSGIIAESS